MKTLNIYNLWDETDEHFPILSHILRANIFPGNNFIPSRLISDYISRFLGRMMAFIFQPQNNKHGHESENLPGSWP